MNLKNLTSICLTCKAKLFTYSVNESECKYYKTHENICWECLAKHYGPTITFNNRLKNDPQSIITTPTRKKPMSNLEVNPNKEYFLAGDISASMQERDPKCGGQTKYDYMLEKFESFIKAAEDFDEHGTSTVLLFGEKVTVYDDVKLDDVKDKLRRVKFEGFTGTDLVIDEAYRMHRDEKRDLERKGKTHPGSNLLIFTDGAATNRKAVIQTIIDIANDIKSEDEFQITFLTVGTRDRQLDDFLENMHDEVEKSLKQDFDIVHVDRLEDVSFLGSVSGRLRHTGS